jgi:hypothetical protein
MVLGTIYWLVHIVAAIWVIYDVWANQKRMDPVKKIIWTVCAILFSIITAIIYYFIGRK